MESYNVVKNKGLWRKFFNLVRYAKVPWIGIVLYFIVNLSTVYIAVRLPQVNADIYSGNASVENIIWVIAVELVSAVLVSCMLLAYGVIGGRIDRNFRDAIWNKILRLEPKYFDQVAPNSLLSRITDDAESMKSFILMIVGEVTGVITTIATIAAMSSMNKGLAVIMVIFVPVTMIFGFLLGRLKLTVGNNVKLKLSELTDYLSGQIARITVIKAFNREAYETKRGEEVIAHYYIAERKVQIADFIRFTVSGAISIAPTVALLLAGIYMLETKAITQAGWIVFYVYAHSVMYFFTSKVDTWIDMKEYQGRMNRLSELFAAPEEGTCAYTEENVQVGDIQFDHVSFSYEDHMILDDISFTIPQKQFTALLGPSGTGKTTVLKLIERIYNVDEGKVLLNHLDIQDYKLENLRKQMSYVKQDAPLISGSIRDNVLYGVERDVSDEEIMIAAKEVRADEFISLCVGQLDYDVGQFGCKLSGGQKQKLSILRAFLQNREYILLDEPTASLDVMAANDVIETIRSLIGKRTVIMVAHDNRLVKDASHLVILEGEGQVHEGSYDILVEKSEFFCQLVSTSIEGD